MNDQDRQIISTHEGLKVESESLDNVLQAMSMACADLPPTQRPAMSWLVMMAQDHATHLRIAVGSLLADKKEGVAK